MNNFKKIYNTIEAIKGQYELGNITEEEAKQQTNEAYDLLKELYPDTPKYGAACTIYHAYNNYRRSPKLNYLDFNDCLFESQIADIAEVLKENDIATFTISSNYSGFMGIAWLFKKNDYELTTLTEITQTGYRGDDRVVPACMFELKGE